MYQMLLLKDSLTDIVTHNKHQPSVNKMSNSILKRIQLVLGFFTSSEDKYLNMHKDGKIQQYTKVGKNDKMC